MRGRTIRRSSRTNEKAGLLDEFHMSIAHVLLGEGVRLFDHLGASPVQLEHIRTLETPGATHLSFRVVK